MLLSQWLKNISSALSLGPTASAKRGRRVSRMATLEQNRWGTSATERLEVRTLLSSVTVNGTVGNDEIVLSESPGDIILVTINGETDEYSKPLQGDDLEFIVDGLGGNDRITVEGDIRFTSNPDVGFVLKAEEIVVNQGVTIEAGDITFSAEGSDVGLSIADNLPIGASVGDRSITVHSGATLMATDVTLEAQRVNSLLHGFRPFGGSDNGADIVISGSSINATGDVSITTKAADENILDDIPTSASNAGTDSAISLASGFFFDGLMPSIPLALMIRKSETSITIDGATTINAGGNVEISSNSVTDATTSAVTGNYGDKTDSGLAKFLDSLSVGYSQADAAASVSLSGSTSITAGGKVDVKSKAKSIAAVTATTKRNTSAGDTSSSDPAKRSPSDTSALGASFAMSNTHTTATTSITEGVTIYADGNVNVKAEGDVTNKAKAGLKIYVDGKGGLAVAVGLDETNVIAAVDGTINSAAGSKTTVTLPLASIDDSTDIINIEGHGLTDGEVVTYRAIDPADAKTDEGDEKLLDSIGGVSDGLEYRVIVIDDDHFQLAQASAIDIDARAIPADQQHTLRRSEVVTIHPENSVSIDNNAIGLPTDLLSTGDLVTYQIADSDADANGDPEAIGGLIDGETYIVTLVAQNGTTAIVQLADLQDPTTPLDLTSFGKGDSHLFGFHRSGNDAITFAPGTSVAHEDDSITLPNHGLSTGDAIYYETDRDADPIRRNVTRNTFLLPPQTVEFSAAAVSDSGAVDTDNDTITVLDAVELATGHRVTYSAVGAAIGGLTDGATYFAIRLSDSNSSQNSFQLAATQADALNGIAIDLTTVGSGSGSGNHSVTSDPIHNDELAIRNHGFETGQAVTYRADGAPSAGLVDGDTYFVIRQDENRLQLANRRSDALIGTARGLTDSFELNQFQRLESAFVVEQFDATRTQPTIDAADNTLNIPGHGLVNGATVVYRSSGPAPGDVEADTTYRVQVVDADHIRLMYEDVDDIVDLAVPTDVGNGFHQLDVMYSDIDLATNVLFLSDHGFQTGDIVEYSTGGDTAIGGLTNEDQYEVERLNGDEIQLISLDADGVPTGNIVDLAAGATLDAVHELVLADDDEAQPLLFTPNVLSPASGVVQVTFDANALPSIDTSTNVIRMLYHGMETGDQVRYLSDAEITDGTLVGGLNNGQTYEVFVVDEHHLQLRFVGGTDTVDLTSAATGNARHGLERLASVRVFQSPIRGLEDRSLYFVSVVDENTIKLSESEGDAFALLPVDLASQSATGDAHQLKIQSSSGIGIVSKLSAKNEVQAGSGLGGAPKFTDLLFSGDTQSPFSFTDPSSFKDPKGSSSLQRGILGNNAKDTLRGSGGETNDTFSVAAALAVTQVDHDVQTVIGPNAQLTSAIDVDIKSKVTQKLKLKAEGTVSSDDKQEDPENLNKPKKRDKDKKFAFGAGIAVGFFDNAAIVNIRSGADINAADDVDIDATVKYPLKANPISLLPFGGYYEPDGKSPEDVDFLGELKSLIGGKLGLDDIVNVWANSKAGGAGTKDGGAAKVALSGSIAVTDYENIARVLVGSGVNINQNVELQNVSQSVSIDSMVKMELVSVAGQISIGLNKEGVQNAHKKRLAGDKWASKIFSLYGNQASEVGIGGSALSQNINNYVESRIETGARIYTGIDGRLAVNATEDIFTFEFVQSGGKSGKIGISGTVSVIQQDSHTVAHLENGVTVTGGDVRVDAENRTRHIALLGAIQTGKSLGVGITAGVQLIERNTLAIVGNELVNITADAVDDDKDRIRIPAHGFFSGDQVRYSSEGGPAIGGLVDGQTYFVVKANESWIQLAATKANAVDDAPDVIGLNASGAGEDHQFEVIRNQDFADFVPADVTGVTDTVTVQDHGFQTGDAVFYSHAGATAAGGVGPAPGVYFVIRINDDQLQLAETRANAAAGIVIPLTTQDATGVQRLQRVLLFDVADVDVNAVNDGYIASVGIAGASVSNTKDSEESTEEQGPSSEGATGILDAAGDLGLDSGSSSGGITGGIVGDVQDNSSPRKSGVAIAGDASWNQIDDRALAIVNDRGWIQASNVGVDAANTTDVYAVSGAVAIANADDTAVALAGSFQRNKAHLTTEAIVGGGAELDLSGSLSADAHRTGDLIGISVGVAGSKVSNNASKGNKRKGFAFGGSVAVNTIDNITKATIDDVHGVVDGLVKANTANDSIIFAIGGGAGIAINGQVGFGAGVGVNTVRTTTESVVDNADLTLGGSLNVTTTNDILLESLGVSAGIGQFGIAGTFAVNEIDPVTSAIVRNSNFAMSDEDVNITALDKSRIRADAGGVAVGIKNAKAGSDENATSGAFGVAVSLNQIGTRDGSGTIAALQNSNIDNPGDLTIAAESTAQITGLTIAGAVALSKQSGTQKGSLSLAGAGAGSRNLLTTDIIASIEDSTVASPDTVSVTATDHSRIHTDAGGFAVSASLNSGGGSSNAVGVGIGVAVNDLFGETRAEIANSQVGVGTQATAVQVHAVSEDPGNDKAIEALAMGGGVAVGIGTGGGQSGAFAGAGAITRNRVFRNVAAEVVDSTVRATETIDVTAFDKATINADSGGVSIAISASTGGSSGSSGSGSIGVSVAVNEIGDRDEGLGIVEAIVRGSHLTSGSDITIDAASIATIDAVTIAGSLSVSATANGSANSISGSGAGSFSDNVIQKTIQAAALDRSFIISSGGDVDVSASDDSFIRSVVVGAAVSVSVSSGGTAASLTIGASIAHNTIDNDTRALVDDSFVRADGDFTVRSTADSTSLGSLPMTIPAALIAPGTLAGSFLTIVAPLQIVPTNLTTAAMLDELATREGNNKETDENERKLDREGLDPVFEYVLREMWNDPETLGGDLSDSFNVTFMSSDEVEEEAQSIVGNRATGNGWMIADRRNMRTYQVLELDDGTLNVRSVNIQAISAAASVAVGAGSNSISIAGAGASTRNIVLSKNEAIVTGSTIAARGRTADSDGDVNIEARKISGIVSTVVAAAVGVGVSTGGSGGSASIGAALARNFIGYDEDGNRDAASAIARLENTSTTATGELNVNAVTAQKITTVVIAATVAVSASVGSGVSIGVSGAGASAINRIAADAEAEIRGVTEGVLNTDTINVSALDQSIIRATAGAVAVGVSFSADNAVAVSLGVGLARNTITSESTARIVDSTLDNVGANLTVDATTTSQIEAVAFAAAVAVGASPGIAGVAFSGAGAEATNIIQTITHANISGSTVTLLDNVSVDSKSLAEIEAIVVSISIGAGGGAAGGVGASIGVSLARNYIGYLPDTAFTPTLTTADTDVRSVQQGETVRIESGVRAGDVYRYIGRDEDGNPNSIDAPDDFDDNIPEEIKISWLSTIDFSKVDQWQLVNLGLQSSSVKATINDSVINIGEDLSVIANASQNINAIVVAGSAALGIGGFLGGALSGSGVSAVNRIANTVLADIVSTTQVQNNARSVTVRAIDDSDIDVLAGAVSLAAAFSGGLAVSVSLGVSLAHNDIQNDVNAAIRGTVFDTVNDIVVAAQETSTIKATSFAASASVAFAGFAVGVSLSGAGADAINSINNQTGALVEDSILRSNARDIIVNAVNSSILDAEVVAVSAAVSGGPAAVAGSIGAALTRNMIGTDSPTGTRKQHSTTATVRNSTLTAIPRGGAPGGAVSVTATSNETIRSLGAAGAVAIAVGAGFGGAGTGTDVVSIISGRTIAEVLHSELRSRGDVNVRATNNSSIVEVEAVGAAVAGGFVAGAIGVTLVHNEITNDVQAIAHSDASLFGDNVAVTASSTGQIGTVDKPIAAATAAVSAGVAGFSGAGVEVLNVIQNNVNATTAGSSEVVADADFTVDAQETGSIYTDAEAIATSFSIGLAGGVTVLDSTINSVIQANVDNTDVQAEGDVIINAQSFAQIPENRAVAVAASIGAGVAQNRANSTISSIVSADATNSRLEADQVSITADAIYDARAAADGGAFGGVADTGMVATVRLGAGHAVNEVKATVGNGTSVVAQHFTVSANSNDTLEAITTAASIGVIAVEASKSDIASDVHTHVAIGDNASINAETVSISTFHSQQLDSIADSFSIGVGSGSGAQVDSVTTGGATIDIGESSRIIGRDINIDARNQVRSGRDNVRELYAGPYGAVSGSEVFATTYLGAAAVPLEARVAFQPGASIQTIAQNGQPSNLTITSFNDIDGQQQVELEGGALVAITKAVSTLASHSHASVDLNGAKLVNRFGDINIIANTDAKLNSDGELLIFSGGGGSSVEPQAFLNSANSIEVNGGELLGQDINLWSGRSTDSIGAIVSSRLDSQTYTGVTTVSLVNVDSSRPTTHLDWNNDISIVGGAEVTALRNVNAIADRLDERLPRIAAEGAVLNIGLGAIGSDLELDTSQSQLRGSANVHIGRNTEVRGGLENESVVVIKPSSVNGVRDPDANRVGQNLTAADKSRLGLSENVDFKFSEPDLSAIPLTVNDAMSVRVADGHTAGGIVGRLYRFIPEASEAILLEREDYSDTSRWQLIDQEDSVVRLPEYVSDQTVQLAASLQGLFYTVQNVDQPPVFLTIENAGIRLLLQRQQIVDWMFSHAGDDEAIARYQAQLDAVDLTIDQLGLFIENEYTDENGNQVIERIPSPEFDAVYVHVPDVEATPGSVFLEGLTTNAPSAILSGALSGSAGSLIRLTNNTPFNMVTGDATINSNRRVTFVDDQLITLESGRVYMNNIPIDDESGNSANEIRIISDAAPITSNDLNGRDVPELPVDLFIQGDVTNEDGLVFIRNFDDSIYVEGSIRAGSQDIVASGDFNLNTEGFQHIGGDPRQLIDWTGLRNHARDNGAINERQAPDHLFEAFEDAEGRLIAAGNITVTARYLNLNGLVQSGLDSIELTVDETFAAGSTNSNLSDDNGNPVAGVSFGAADIPSVSAYYDSSRGAIVVEPIELRGGNIVLAGQIFNTGIGRLRAASGRANVTIINESGLDTVIQGIDNTADREGRITVIDTSLLTRTVYRDTPEGIHTEFFTGQNTGTAINYTSQGSNVSTNQVRYWPGSDNQLVDDVATNGLQYTWVDGQDFSTETESTYIKRGFNLFGVNNSVSDSLVDDEFLVSRIGPRNLDDEPLLISEAVGGQAGSVPALQLDFERVNLGGSRELADFTVSGGKWLRPFTATAVVVDSAINKDIYTTRLRADRPVFVSFASGSDEPKVQVISTGHVHLEGSIRASDTGHVKVTSEFGAIRTPGTAGLYGDSVATQFRMDSNLIIEGGAAFHAIGQNQASLTATSVSDDNQSSTIDVELITAGDVTLIGPNGINTHADAASGVPVITARNLSLNASDGRIDALRVNTTGIGRIDAFAQSGINITETFGDLRLGIIDNYVTDNGDSASVVSIDGTVILNAEAGNIVDVLADRDRALTNEEAAELDERLRLTGEAAEAAAREQIEIEQRRETATYHDYWRIVRQATPGEVMDFSPVRQINGDSIELEFELDLRNGDVVFYELGFDLTDDALFAASTWEPLNELPEDEAVTHDASQLSAGELTVMNPGEIVLNTNGELYRYVGGTVPSWDLIPGQYFKFGGNEVIQLGTSRYETALNLNPELFNAAGTTGSFDQVMFRVRSFDSIDHSSVDVAALTQEQRQRFLPLHNLLSDADEYDSNFVYRLSSTEINERIAARSLNKDQLQFPLTGQLLVNLLPASEISLAETGASRDSEFPNIVARSVQLTASQRSNGDGGQVGTTVTARYIDYRNGFAALSDEDKGALSEAAAEDVAFKHYTTYQYQGAAGSFDAETIDFTSNQWIRLDPDLVSSQIPSSAPAPAMGSLILNDFPVGGGLYRFIGTAIDTETFDWQSISFSNSTYFELLTPAGSNLNGQIALQPGDFVSDITDLQFVTLQPVEDVNIAAQVDSVRLRSYTDNGSTIRSNDDIVVVQMLGGDIRLSTTGAITTGFFSPDDVGNIATDGDVFIRAASLGATNGGAFPVQIYGDGTLGGSVDDTFLVRQTPLAFENNPVTGIEISRIDAGGQVAITSDPSWIHLGTISTSGDVQLDAETVILSITPKQPNEIIANITAANARLVSGVAIGESGGTRDVGVNLSGHLQAITLGDVRISGTTDLDIAAINAGSVRILSLADINLIEQGRILSTTGVTLRASDTVSTAATSSITAAGSIAVFSDVNDDDAEGGVITLEGPVNTSLVFVVTHHGDDLIDVSNLVAPATINSGDGDDQIISGQAEDTINAGPGNDFVSAGPGPDRIRGGTGDDELYGGPGDDTYIFENVAANGESDLISELPNEGIDTVDFTQTTAATTAQPSTTNLVENAIRTVRLPNATQRTNFEHGLNIDPLIEVTMTPANLSTGVLGDFEATWYDVGTQTIHQSEIDWGDSSSEPGTLVDNGITGTISGQHAFDAPSTFQAQFTISDDNGNSSKAETSITTTDDGSPARIDIELSATVGNEKDSTQITVQAVASKPVDGDQSVSVELSGNGITTSDYLLSASEIIIPDGAMSGSITLTIQQDTTFESEERAIVTLAGHSSGIVAGQSSAELRIIDYHRVEIANAIDYGNGDATLDWQEIPGATYQVWLSQLTPRQSVTRVFDLTENKWEPDEILTAGTYRFWVIAIDSEGAVGQWSTGRTFDVHPTLIGPLGSTFDARPTFAWESIPGAESYEIYIRDGANVIRRSGITSTRWQHDSAFDKDNLRWWIRPDGSFGNRGWSRVGEVRIDGRTEIQSVSPEGNDGAQQFSWGAVEGASRYILHVVRLDEPQLVIRENTLTSDTFVSTSLASGTYRAWIKAIDGTTNLFSNGLWSRNFDFTVADLNTESPEDDNFFTLASLHQPLLEQNVTANSQTTPYETTDDEPRPRPAIDEPTKQRTTPRSKAEISAAASPSADDTTEAFIDAAFALSTTKEVLWQ